MDNKNKRGKLFVIATPIGHLDDITKRALDTLEKVDLVCCEDSRVSAKLLEKYGIKTKTVSYHKFNEKQRSGMILDMLDAGKSVGLISDAGTPCISDPGRVLINELQDKGVDVVPVVGACALTAFLSVVPKLAEEFKFVGFIPRIENQRTKIFDNNKDVDLVFYETANRLMKTLENIKSVRGENTKVAVGRELTKVFEEVLIKPVNEMIEYYQTNTLKGEIVAMVYAEEDLKVEEAELLDKIKKLQKQKFSNKDISIILSELYNVNKNSAYQLTIKANSLNKPDSPIL